MSAPTLPDVSAVNRFWGSPDEALFFQPEIAQVLRKSEPWLERARSYGGGPKFLKLGRSVRYRKSDVLAWINSHAPVGSTSEYPQSQAA